MATNGWPKTRVPLCPLSEGLGVTDRQGRFKYEAVRGCPAATEKGLSAEPKIHGAFRYVVAEQEVAEQK